VEDMTELEVAQWSVKVNVHMNMDNVKYISGHSWREPSWKYNKSERKLLEETKTLSKSKFFNHRKMDECLVLQFKLVK
jgi:hypothetical protein